MSSINNLFLDFITGRYTDSSVFLLLVGIVVITVSALGKTSLFNFTFVGSARRNHLEPKLGKEGNRLLRNVRQLW